MNNFANAQALLEEFKGDHYRYGMGVLNQTGELASSLGKKSIVIQDEFVGSRESLDRILESLKAGGVQVLRQEPGARPNAPREDVFRLAEAIRSAHPELVVSFGGGSTTDAAKAAIVLACLGGEIDAYFGTGLVSGALADQRARLTPHLAIQTAASSGAHLTKYSNVTDLTTGQKKLIVDDAIIPPRALFDYMVTLEAPLHLTADGGLDAISHALEVLFGVVGKPAYSRVRPVALEAIRLVVGYLPAVMRRPDDLEGREAIGLATDLGGYAIMLGGTNGAHLTSFSLVDILSHGRACGLLNPYYAVFFAPAVQEPLREVGKIYQQAGYSSADFENLSGRALGMAAAKAMIAFEQAVGLPTRLVDIPGFSEAHIERALTAAKMPELKMKLENMPVPMSADLVDQYMEPILRAATTGDLDLIRNLE